MLYPNSAGSGGTAEGSARAAAVAEAKDPPGGGEADARAPGSNPIQASPSFASGTSSGPGGAGGGGSAQTRFSFYNADDFKVVVGTPSSEVRQNRPGAGGGGGTTPKSPAAAAAAAAVAGSTMNAPTSSSPASNAAARRSFFMSHAKSRSSQHEHRGRLSSRGAETDGARPHSLVDTSTTDNMVRSLQRKEQQRVELRQGLRLARDEEEPPPGLAPPPRTDGAAAPAATATLPPSNNPYEDAIKEALELLRKHRVALSPKALPKQQSSSARNGDAGFAGATTPRLGSQEGLPFTPRHADRVLQSRGDDSSSVDAGGRGGLRSISSSTAAAHPNALVTPPIPDTPDSSFLGEAYQVEIEARRRQRQERMAKYASRLAELKQDSDSATPLHGSNADSHSLPAPDRRQRSQLSNRPRDQAEQQEDLTHHDPHDAGADRQYTESEVTAGTISTMTAGTNHNIKEEEVQRGVEKVLMAILERANHRSLSSQSQSTSAGGVGYGGAESQHPDDSLEGGDRPSSWQRGEEKKSNSEECLTLNDAAVDENTLVQAVSDLLGVRRSSSSSIGLATTRSRSPEAQPHPGSFRYSDMAPSIDVDDYDPISASRSMSDAGGFPSSSFPGVPSSVAKPPPPPRHHRTVSSPLPVSSQPEVSTSFYATELTNTSDGQIEAVASDPGMMTELDELVRKVSDRSHEKYLRSSSSNFENDNPSTAASIESIDEKVRLLLGSDEDRGSRCEQEESEEDESIENTSVMDPTSNASASSFDESLLDNEDEFDDRSDPRNQSAIDMVLGPLSRKGTGVVLEPDSPRQQASLLESLSAAVSLVVSGNSAGGSKGGGIFSDKYASEDEDSDDSQTETSASDASESNGLMRSLCAHLLPVGVSQTSRILEKLPEWDESNPDEPGFRIVRLTRHQLRRVEDEFKHMVDTLKHSSEQNLRRLAGSDETFERDLQAAEELLDKEEERLKATSVSDPPVCHRETPSSPDRRSVVSADDDNASVRLPNFPGVKRAGEGEMGDLEFFHLPIIFKSHVTGFEPTKDLSLESGNVIAGQYLVEGELGSAAFSTAYKCVDLNSEGGGPDGHEEVCLKVIKNTKDFFDQSLDEIKILELLRQTGQCREKCIVEMRTFFYHREHLIIVTELLKQNLFEFGKWIVDNDEEPYFTLPRLAFITRQVLIALDFVHSLGLVHSDVKPENILLGSCSRAKVKLIDFGSSCYLTDRQSSYIQSRSYRAPEVVLGLPYDGRIDVWSLGCVVAEMFTGEVTFQNDSIVAMLSRIEAICGPFPRHMIAQGRQAGRFFTKCGLLFERAHRERDEGSTVSSDDEPKVEAHYDIFQPKVTTLAARLGFDSNLLDDYCNESVASTAKRILAGDRPSEVKRRGMFVDFVRQLLTIDPETRPSASQALQHPWMQYAASLTEDDIFYPASTG